MDVLDIVMPASSVLVLLVTGAFLIVFAREPWVRHPFGQSVMVLTVGVMLLAALGLAVYVLGPDYPGREYAVLTGRLLIVAAMGQRLFVLLRERRKDHHNDGGNEPMTHYPAPSPTYLGPPAKHSGTGNKPITRVVIHSAVMPCEPGRARQLAEMNRRGTGGGSWHYAVDPSEVVQCSYDSVVCHHAPPNAHSIGIEMADWPDPMPAPEGTDRWKRLRLRWRWTGIRHQRMLNRTARLTAELCLAYDLPIRFLSPADLRAGARGITTHANVSKAFGQSTHWDPGYWPRYGFMSLVRAHARRIRKAAAS